MVSYLPLSFEMLARALLPMSSELPHVTAREIFTMLALVILACFFLYGVDLECTIHFLARE